MGGKHFNSSALQKRNGDTRPPWGTRVPLKPLCAVDAQWMRRGVAGGVRRPLVGFTGMAQR